MKAQYIKDGRFDQAIWIDYEPEDLLAEYPRSKALPIGVALDLWKDLTRSLVNAGQAGTLDAGARDFIRSK